MFYAIRRMIKLFLGLCLLAILVWAWQQRAALEPAFVWYDVYKNGGHTNTTALPTVTGRVLRVIDAQTFEIRPKKGNFITVRLTGLEEEPLPTTREEATLQWQKKTALSNMVLSNFVHVDVTYSNVNSVLGIAHCKGTNVNAALIEKRVATLKPSYIKQVPRQTQYRLFYARRAAEKASELQESFEQTAQAR